MEIEIETVFKAITEPILSSKTVHFQSNYTKTAFRMISVSNLLCDYLNFFWFFSFFYNAGIVLDGAR